MRSLCVAVPKEKAETVRQALLTQGLLRKGVAIDREGETVYLPVTGTPSVGFPVLEREVRESFSPIRSYRDIAEVPANLKSLLPTSFDVVGDVAIFRIPEEFTRFEGAIASAILRAN